MFKPIDPKPDFPKLEEEILKFWEDNKIFEKSLVQTQNGQPYTFYDGPPFATGLPHYGHILASTIKDLIPRYQTMKGRFVRRRWGWDTHGLPIEEIVERKLGISGKKDIEKLGIAKFNETCRSMVMEYVGEWRKTVRRIARWIDFDNSYKTMDRDYMESVWWAFKQIYDKGLIYEGRRVLLYCPRCETPISNFEVAMDNSYKDVTEEAVTVKFKVRGQGGGDRVKENTYILAWTTTPWTLPGNVALAVGKDIEYVQTEIPDNFNPASFGLVNFDVPHGNYIYSREAALKGFSASKLLHQLDWLAGMQHVKSKVMKGSDLVGLEYEPLFVVEGIKGAKGSHRVYAADFVTTEDGTGVVHTAVVYGEDDYNLGLKEGLPVVPMLDEKGIFNEKSPELIRGQYFKQAEKLIKKDLDERGLIFERKGYTHSYPHCWRCGTALFYNAIPAWFMNIQKIKSGLLESNDKQVNWYPEHLKHGRYQKSVEAAPDWNISRNRYWGNPIPVWKCEAGHNTVVGSIKDLGLARNTFYFARHGESTKNILGISNAKIETDNFPLTDKGRADAEKVGKELKAKGRIDLIFSSDFLRTKSTAEIIAKQLRVPAVELDPRLREHNNGIYDNRPVADFYGYLDEHDIWTEAPKGGETLAQVQERMVEVITEINQKYQGKRILIIGHGDPLKVLLGYYGSEMEDPNKYTDRVYEVDVSIADLHRPYIDDVVIKCKECGKDARRVTEIFDSWVEAGSMPFAEYHYPFDQKQVFERRFPGQFVAEYIAQTRAWFYVMHVIGYNLFGKAPFENVVTTGTILAEDGSKMSKSKNNYPDPWKVIEQYGVDALRFYLMNSPVMSADNLNFSERELGVVYRKNILILWNVFNYFVTYANEAGYEPDLKFKINNLKFILDQWITAKTQELVNIVTDELDGYNTVRATRAIEDYINELSTWYLRRSRGRKDAHFFGTMRHCLLTLSKVIAPTMPYMAELIYQNLNRNPEVLSAHLAKWPEKKELNTDQKELLEKMNLTRTLVELGHSIRKREHIKLRQPLQNASYHSSKGKLNPELEELLADELNVKEIKILPTKNIGVQIDPEVIFDTTLTKELKQAGLAAELTRAVQEMRKKLGLKVGQPTKLGYNTDDKELQAALKQLDTKKTYISEIVEQVGGEEIEIEGKKIQLNLSKQ